ncbi:MAG: hypothetical protein QOF66_3655 [Mycobacterium sp.]|jgi:hypothetical protein|nr:hypothetical protein [Mycobacterium sp.]MDT5055289.1 hypothetical protein [Mycobacterium sp.]
MLGRRGQSSSSIGSLANNTEASEVSWRVTTRLRRADRTVGT